MKISKAIFAAQLLVACHAEDLALFNPVSREPDAARMTDPGAGGRPESPTMVTAGSGGAGGAGDSPGMTASGGAGGSPAAGKGGTGGSAEGDLYAPRSGPFKMLAYSK